MTVCPVSSPEFHRVAAQIDLIGRYQAGRIFHFWGETQNVWIGIRLDVVHLGVRVCLATVAV